MTGRELMLDLARYLLTSRHARLVLEHTEIHIMPSMNPDGFSRAIRGGCDWNGTGGIGRRNANDVDLNRDFPGPSQVLLTGPLVISHWWARVSVLGGSGLGFQEAGCLEKLVKKWDGIILP